MVPMKLSTFTVLMCVILPGCIADRTAVENDGISMDVEEVVSESDTAGELSTDSGGASDANVPATNPSEDGSVATDALNVGQGVVLRDVGIQGPDAAMNMGARCIQACSDVVDCLGDECGDSALGNYAQCVEACTTGVIRLEDIESTSCNDLQRWVCETPFAGACGCRLDGCERSCENVLQCLEPICDREVITLDACIDYCQQSPEDFSSLGLDSVACDEVQRGICPQITDECGGCPQPDPDIFNLGTACERDADCQAGTLRPYCIPAMDPAGSGDTGWLDGYCTGIDCGPGDCGPNGVCVGINEMGQTACFALCEPGLEVCRMGYICENLGRRDISACIPF